MRKSLACLLTASFLLAGTAIPARADLVSDMHQCANIKYGRDRLRCFDALASDLHKYIAPPPVAGEPVAKPPVARKTDFGMEHELAKATPQSVRASISGPFKGWSGKTEFKLDNGQVWRQLVSGKFRVNLDSPKVTIEKGMFGGYYLKVDGYNKTVRVRRIK